MRKTHSVFHACPLSIWNSFVAYDTQWYKDNLLMAARDTDSQHTSATMQELFPPTELETPSRPALPPELTSQARLLERALSDRPQLPQAFANFCSAAYVKPEWAGAASEYLTSVFEDEEDLLAEMTRVPDLVIELASGHYSLTFLVVSSWAEKGDIARLIRLAEALIATQSKMSGPEVVDVMLALATSLAISRYTRAEQLVNLAQPLTAEDQQDALKEARLWLEAGSLVRSCPQEIRDLWDHRLRRSRTAWTWTAREEREALTQLADQLDTKLEALCLYQAIVPACWWDLAITRVREHAEFETLLEAEAQKTAAAQAQSPVEVPTERPTIISKKIVVWRALPFFLGGLVGAWAFVLGLQFSPFEITRKPTEKAPVAETPTVAPTNPSSETPPTTPAASAPESATSPTPSAPTAEHPNAAWRREQAAIIAEEMPALQPLMDRLKTGDWATHQALLEGTTPDLPQADPGYLKLLLWLHLDPPTDPDLRSRIPGLLASQRQDSLVLDLWEKLVYPGSPNAQDIQLAAQRQHHDNASSWSPSQRAVLNHIGWDALPKP